MPFLLSLIGNRWAMVAVAALGGFFYGFYSVPRVDVPAIVRNAEAGRDAYWRDVLRKKEKEAAATIADIVKSVDEQEAAEPAPTTKTELDDLCAKSTMCRENK